MRILIESREQMPFSFQGYEVETEVVGLPVGHYSLPGFEDRAAIERKALDDLIGCLMGQNRERFEREIAKGKAYDLCAVLAEATLADVLHGRYRSEMKVHSVLQSLATFTVRYGTSFIWSGDRQGAEHITFSLLAKYLYEIEKRYRLASRGQLVAGQPISGRTAEAMS